jgi:deoxyribonuclease V
LSQTRRSSFKHAWDLTPAQARQLQEELRGQVIQQPLSLEKVSRVAGLDASFHQGMVIGAAVVLDLADLQPVAQAVVEMSVPFPYVPGLLSFRETPVLLKAIEQLSILPQVFIVDGHGYAHPRRFGIACHLGVLMDLPAIGLAKSILVGKSEPLDGRVGSLAELRDGDEIVGMTVRTRSGSKPVYVSVGHRIDLPSAVAMILRCSKGYRLPEPARLAHRLASSAKKGIPR